LHKLEVSHWNFVSNVNIILSNFPFRLAPLNK
jgi:hypothetical protein